MIPSTKSGGVTMFVFRIGRRWSNQHGSGVKTSTLYSKTNPPEALPKGYKLRGYIGTAKSSAAPEFPETKALRWNA